MVQSHTSWNMWQFVGAGQARLCLPLRAGKRGKLWNFPHWVFWEQSVWEISGFVNSLGFFLIWLCVTRSENSSRKVTVFFRSILNFWGEFSISCSFFFLPLLKIKVRISSHSLIKPPGFIHCIFPVVHWSIKGFLTNSTYQDFAVEINLVKWQ